MPPKKTDSLLHSISVANSNSTRFRSNMASDLITKSEAALSSQASVYTQQTTNTQASQDNNNNFNFADNDDDEFNREQMSEVRITKEEQQVITKILQVARKGKINAKNAFQIPIKVVHSDSAFSVNNKFWRFASQLLHASMSIYDKRVQNMYISTGEFENKLSRIGFQIKKKKQHGQQSHDDINEDEEQKRKKNHQERYQNLQKNIDDVSKSLNLEDEGIIGFQTLQKKQKLDIKNMENKFIADPTFQRTQKMFDSYSLRSLMMNIFQLSTQLDVRIFYKSDLEWQRLKNNQSQIMNQTFQFSQQSIDNSQRQADYSQKQVQVDGPLRIEQDQNNQSTITNRISQNNPLNRMKEGRQQQQQVPLSNFLLQHLRQSSKISKQNELFSQITNFISNQVQLKEQYKQRMKKYQNTSNKLQVENVDHQQDNNITYQQLIQNQTNQYLELFRQYTQTYNEELGAHQFQQIQNGQGLFQTHQVYSQSQSVDNFPNFHFSSDMNNPPSGQLQELSEAHSMPLSFQQTFYKIDQNNNIIEPIMPWQIQFKNLKLTNKRKKGSKKNKNTSLKSKKTAAVHMVDFSLQIDDKQETFKNQNQKEKFQDTLSKSKKIKLKEKNKMAMQYQTPHTMYHRRHTKAFGSSTGSIAGSRVSGLPRESQQVSSHQDGFLLDLNDNMDPRFSSKIKTQQDIADEQTRLNQPQNFQNSSNSFDFFNSGQKQTKNTSFFGNQMGISNIRQIKKMIVNQVNEKGQTTLQDMNRILHNLSPQQLFTIFLHLTNENQFEIKHEPVNDQTTIVLSLSQRAQHRGGRFDLSNLADQVEI